MSDLTRRAGRAAEQAPVDHDPRPDAGRRFDVGEVGTVAARAPGQLGQGAEVRVVLDLDRNPQALLHLRRDAEPNPARQDGGRSGGATRRVDGARDTHAGAQHGRAVDADLGQDLRKHRCRDVKSSTGFAIYVQVRPMFGEHVVAEVGHGDRHMAVPEVDADHDPRWVAKHELHPWPPASGVARPGVHVGDQALVLELVDQGRYRRPGKAGGPRDIGLADPAVHPQDLHHALAVAMPQPGQGSIAIFRARHACDIMGVPDCLSRAQTNHRTPTDDLLTNPRA